MDSLAQKTVIHGPPSAYCTVRMSAITTRSAICGIAAILAGACTTTRGDDPFATGSAAEAGTESASSASASGSASASSAGTGSATESGPDSAEDTGIKFDTPVGETENADDGTSKGACEKVDFLFIIDNSISMGDEQQNLSASFPGFIATIQQDVVSDYHVMVIDTDGEDKWDEELTECHQSDCIGEDPTEACGVLPPENGWLCGNLPVPDPCDAQLGAGNDHDDSEARNSCGIVGGKRWFDDSEPDPAATFDCVANLYAGNSPELTMEGMLNAVSPAMVGAGGCNEGFLRDDAVLVVTFISDEEDSGDSPGDPTSWHDDLLALKNGNETAIVVLGLLGDTSLPMAVCPPDSVPGSNGGEYSPRLIEFVESFGDRGLWGSVCAPDYSPFFEQAVALIDFACEEFEPEG